MHKMNLLWLYDVTTIVDWTTFIFVGSLNLSTFNAAPRHSIQWTFNPFTYALRIRANNRYTSGEIIIDYFDYQLVAFFFDVVLFKCRKPSSAKIFWFAFFSWICIVVQSSSYWLASCHFLKEFLNFWWFGLWVYYLVF